MDGVNLEERVLKTGQSDLERLLPLSPAMFHVLLSLAEGDKHGYAILKGVALATDERVRLSTGTLYGILKRLLSDRLIEKTGQSAATAGEDERRRTYRLTDRGRRLARLEAVRLEALVRMARETRLLDGGVP